MTVTQARFRTALLNAELPVPEGLQDAAGDAAGARFSVYRNNVIVSLTEALATAFPLVRRLIGSEAFARLAVLFVRAHPPESPLMMFYGRALPAFLEDFEPLKSIGYLPDCARLDLAMRQSYHAADAAALDPSVLQQSAAKGVDPRLGLAPSARILRSDWPLFDIWRFNMVADAPKPRAVAQDVLVTRPAFDPQPNLLPPGAADWLDRLHGGTPLGQAAEEVLSYIPDFDLAEALTLALNMHALVQDRTKET
jgi:hypothetical protein